MAILLLLYYCALVSIAHGNSPLKTRCPIWMREVHNTSECICASSLNIICTNKDSVTMQEGYCLSVDNDTELVTGLCPYSYQQLEYAKNLNSSITPAELNEVMCGPLNREGLFCRKCKPGYGIPVFSKVADECVPCTSKLTWLLYLALELIPVTAFYILVLIFNFSVTHPPFTAYIFYCQLFIHITFNVGFIKHSFQTYTNQSFLYLTLTVCDLWNLDMLRWVIPSFCLSPHFSTAIDSLFLDLIVAIYPMLLTLVTVILIEMHASNFRIIVCMWKPFHKCFVSVRRSWDPSSSVVNAIATFLLLSSFKGAFISFDLTYKVNYVVFNGSAYYVQRNRLYFDPTINFNDIYKQSYFVPMLLLIVFFVLLPIVFLGLYPTRICRRFIQCCCSGRIRTILFLFMENFQGCYKNGTSGTYDYRSASCIGFLLRFALCLSLLRSHSRRVSYSTSSITGFGILLIVTSLFYALVQPYKKRYMNVIETLLYAIAGFLSIFIFYEKRIERRFHLILATILMPSVVFVGYVMYKVLNALGIVAKLKKVIGKVIPKKIESEPDRLVNPTEYTPLLQ